MPKDLTDMLKGATNFRADISPWVISKEDTVTNMLEGTALVEQQLFGFTSATPSLIQFNKPICFNKGTKILCLKEGKEQYVCVEDLQQGSMIKTFKHGFQPINDIRKGTYKLNQPGDMGMYRMKKQDHMIADLEMTGLHCLLIDTKDAKYQQDIQNQGGLKNPKFFVDGKFRLRANSCSEFQQMPRTSYTIYSFSLEGKEQYGIWANGALVETTSTRILKLSKMEKVI
tara:strand:- start:1278 stop:1961 length:684 start_codon:yes stop_codon:yes gene_type:complete